MKKKTTKMIAVLGLICSFTSMAASVSQIEKDCSVNTLSLVSAGSPMGGFDEDSFSNATRSVLESKLQRSGFKLVKKGDANFYSPAFVIELKHKDSKILVKVFGELKDGGNGVIFSAQKEVNQSSNETAIELIKKLPSCSEL